MGLVELLPEAVRLYQRTCSYCKVNGCVDEPDQLPSGWVHLALFKGDGVLLGGAALTVCSRSCAAAAVDRVMMVNVSNGRRTDPRPGEVEA